MAITNTLVATTVTSVFYSTGENAVTTMFFCNTSASTDTDIDVYLVPGGTGTIGTSTQIIKTLSLPATETFVFDAEKLILEQDDAVYAKASVNGIVVATISSVQTG